jgi:hypothetical protein
VALLDFDGPCGTEITGAGGAAQVLTLWVQATTSKMSVGFAAWRVGRAIEGGEEEDL